MDSRAESGAVMSDRRQTCTDHASCCSQHFHGLAAFDAHRKDGVCRDASEVLYGPDSKRSGQPVLQSWTESGSCALEKGCYVDGKLDHYVEGVTIWQIAPSAKQQAWFDEKREEQAVLL
jgi:hypothetical protein